MTTCPQTVHEPPGYSVVVARRFAHRSLRGRPRRGGGDCGGELIDTIEGCGDAAFRLRPGGTASDRRVLWTWHGWNANVLVQLPAVDAHQRVAGLKLAERIRVCASLR